MVEHLQYAGVDDIDVLHYSPSGMSTEHIYAVDKDSLYDATSIAKNISVADARLHPLWGMIEQEMNNEIQGKMARGRESWRVVLRPDGVHVMKSRWVISIITMPTVQ